MLFCRNLRNSLVSRVPFIKIKKKYSSEAQQQIAQDSWKNPTIFSFVYSLASNSVSKNRTTFASGINIKATDSTTTTAAAGTAAACCRLLLPLLLHLTKRYRDV